MALKRKPKPKPKPKKKPPAPKPAPQPPASTGSTSPSPEQLGQQASDIAAQDSGMGPMVTSGSTTAPASAYQDAVQNQTDADLDAFFSSGSGPAYHYDSTVTYPQQMATTDTTGQTA